jgi:hypothetical protein
MMPLSFHELNRHQGFKACKEITVFRLGGEQPEKLGTIHCGDCHFEGQYLARMTIDDLKAITAKMEETRHG